MTISTMTTEEERLLVKLLELLKRALPFIEAQWQRSTYGTGYGARDLMNEIKAVLGLK